MGCMDDNAGEHYQCCPWCKKWHWVSVFDKECNQLKKKIKEKIKEKIKKKVKKNSFKAR